MQNIVSLNVWSQIKPTSNESQSKTAAIAYVTSETFVQFGDGDVLVTDASDNAIACGQTSARLLSAAIDRGAKIYSCEGLHAKVIAFDSVAVIGSANLSEHSERDLVEAAWVTDDPTVLASIRRFVECLAAQSQPIDATRLEQILSIRVKRRLTPVSKRNMTLEPDYSSHNADHTASSVPDDDAVERVLSRSEKSTNDSWVLDPQLVLMDREEVYRITGKWPTKSIGPKVWARQVELGTNLETDRSVPRPYHQNFINATVDLAKAKGNAPTRDEILSLVVDRHSSGELPNTLDKRSQQLRNSPYSFFQKHFDPARETSIYKEKTLRYFLHATPDREKEFLSRLGVKRKNV